METVPITIIKPLADRYMNEIADLNMSIDEGVSFVKYSPEFDNSPFEEKQGFLRKLLTMVKRFDLLNNRQVKTYL
jgi:hypothetical protein